MAGSEQVAYEFEGIDYSCMDYFRNSMGTSEARTLTTASWTFACRTSSARIVTRTWQTTIGIDCLFEGIDYT